MSLISNIIADEQAKQAEQAKFEKSEARKADIIMGLMADIRGPMLEMRQFETVLQDELTNTDGEFLVVTVRYKAHDEYLEIWWHEVDSTYSRNVVLRKLNGKMHLNHVTPSTKDECIHILNQLLED